MLTNADCTIYEKESFLRHAINKVFWNDSRGRTAAKGGIQIVDSVVVYIYSGDYVPKSGDIIVKGCADFEFGADSQRTVSERLKLFREQFPDFAVVKNVSDYRFGGLPHIEVTAK